MTAYSSNVMIWQLDNVFQESLCVIIFQMWYKDTFKLSFYWISGYWKSECQCSSVYRIIRYDHGEKYNIG